MHEAFEVHMLNEQGKAKAQRIAKAFDGLLSELEGVGIVDGREMALVRTKLEEACFFAKKAMARRPENQGA